MKIITLSVLIIIVIVGCKKHVDSALQFNLAPEKNSLDGYGHYFEPEMIEIYLRDTAIVNYNVYPYNYITKYNFLKGIYYWDEAKDTVYLTGYQSLGSLVYSERGRLEIQWGSRYDIIDTNSIMVRDSNSITYKINSNLNRSVLFNAYHYLDRKIYASIESGYFGIDIKVYYKGPQSSIEVAKVVNILFRSRIYYYWP